MPEVIEIKTPDLGDFENVPVIEIYVAAGDTVAVDDLLLAIESDKATMEIPSSHAGVIEDVLVSVGDEISSGRVLATVRSDAKNGEPDDGRESKTEESRPAASEKTDQSETDAGADREESSPDVSESRAKKGGRHARLVVLGAGPGGYTAAFRAADLGMEVVLIERYPSLGGVCLNVGCIPSKALLHVAKIISESEQSGEIGITCPPPEIDLKKILDWKNGVVSQLTRGLTGLAEKRKVTVVNGVGKFTGPNVIAVENGGKPQSISFDQAVIAVGSEPIEIPGFPHDDERVMDSTGALAPKEIPANLLIVGGGIIGLEMATVYRALGSRISIVEMLDGLMAGADPDLVRPLAKRLRGQYENIWLNTKVTAMKAQKNGIKVSFEGRDAPAASTFDRVLVSVGRVPNGHKINAQSAGIRVDDRGFIPVDNQQRSNVPHIFAIGDVVGQPMLAHKAVHEGKAAAEVAAGMKSGFDARVIPSVAYTDPEVAWVGVTETEAKARGMDYGKGTFPWAASGRSLSQGRNEGVTKLLFDKNTERIIGAGVTGSNAGDLIAEAVLAIEMNADARDIGLSIHAHPTLAETIGFAAEVYEGTITDLYLPKKKRL